MQLHFSKMHLLLSDLLGCMGARLNTGIQNSVQCTLSHWSAPTYAQGCDVIKVQEWMVAVVSRSVPA